MSEQSVQQAADTRESALSGTDNRTLVVGAAAALVWVLTWLAVQVHAALGWMPPFLSAFR